MKLKASLRTLLALAGSSVISISSGFAQSTLYWDGGTVNIAGSGNSASAGTTGTWNTTLTNWDAGAVPYVAWDNTAPFDTAVFGGTAGTVTLGTSISVDTMNINTAGYAISPSATNQLTVSTINAAGGGTSSFGAAGTVNIGGSLLTVTTATAADRFSFAQEGATNSTRITLNGGAAATSISGPGYVNFRLVANSTTGGISVSGGGTVMLNNIVNDSLGTNNLSINGGLIQVYTGAGTALRGLGAGASQIQITGGRSGFTGAGTVTFTSAATEVVWGSAVFDPSTFVLEQTSTLGNNLNLGGLTRTVESTGGTGTMSGLIRTSTGTAGLTKTGAGTLVLSNTGNTYNGQLTVQNGTLSIATINNVSANGVLGNSTLSVILGNAGAQTGTLQYTSTSTSSTKGFTMATGGTGGFDVSTAATNLTLSGQIDGSGNLSKIGAGTLTLSGTNNYGGVTTVNAGRLTITKEASLNTGAAASWTAAKVNVKRSATLQLNVDLDGSDGFTIANLNTLLGNISVANTAAQGLQAGAILALDTTNAGGNFTPSAAITNSTGAFGGVIGLTKLGTGTLVLDQANTYTGPTTISAGTLQLDAGGVIATSIGNNGTFTVNSAGAVTQGTNFGLIWGTGAVINAGAGTLTLNLANTYSGLTTATAGTIALTNALAIQNSALLTTSGTTTLGAFSAVTIGGLSGATGDLGSTNVLNGYTGNVSALTLNPQSGVSVTYGGVISNGTGAMTLTKTGAGTQILTGANTYTGATIINAGTLTIGVGGSLSSSSDLQINGGTFSYGNTSAGQTLNGLTVGAGNTTVSNTAAGQTLTLGAITRTASVFGTVNFGALTGPISTTTGNTNGIIAPWATTGSTTTLRYAVGSPDGSTLTDITAFTGVAGGTNLVDVTDATVNYEYSAAAATATDLTGNTLRYSGGATGTVIGATNTLTLNGLMNAGTGLLTISGGPSTGGLLIGSSGELVIVANAQGTTISAAIGGTGRLVYSGAGTLLLSSTTSNYSGGTVINSGQLRIASDAALGNSSGSITLNGGTFLGNNTNPQAGNGGGVSITSARDVIVGVAGGSMGAHGNNNFTTSGKLSGTGTLTFADVGGAGGRGLNFNATNNDFTGRISIQSNSMTFSVNSLLDTAGSGNIALNLGGANNGSTFAYGAGAIAPLTLSNRAFELNASNAFTGTIQNNNTTQAISIGSNLIATGAGAKTLVLGAVAGPNNVFSGKITDGPGSVISLTVNGLGHWIVSGDNNYSGQTTVAGSAALTLSGDNSGMTGVIQLSTAGTGTTTPRLNINSATALGTGILNFGGGLATDTVRIDNTSAGTVNVSTANAITMNRNFTFIGTQDLSLGTGTTTLGGMTTGSNRSITVTAKTLTLNGTIAEATTNLGITKAGAGTLLLSGTGNSYTGATSVTGGTLATTTAVQGFGTNLSGINVGGSGTLSLRNDSTVSFTNGTSAYNINNSASGATINVDRVTGTGTNTISVGNLTTTSVAVTWQLNLTGANGVSLNAGAVTTPTAAAGAHTISNAIAGGGNLTLASVAGGGTGATSTLTFTGAGNTTVTGAITQTATNQALTKSGNGSLSLFGSNSYTGQTNVNVGKLFINGDQTAATGAVNVAALATLGGTGIVGGNISIADTGNLEFSISTAPGSHDGLVLDTGKTLDFVNTSALTINSISGGTTGSYILVTAPGGITGVVPAILNLPSGWVANVTKESGDTQLVLNVTSTGSGDATPPTLTSITDDVSGGPINIGATVNYTVTFSEDMDAASVTAADFANNGTAVANVGAVTETITPGVFTVPVTVTSPGTLVLRINALAVLEDVAGNDLDTDPAILDDTTITVRNAYQTWALTNAISSAPGADKDGDGVNNAIEFVLGGTVGGNDLSKLPTVTTTATDLIFSFQRQRSSIDGITGLEIEVGTALTAWPTSYTVGTTTANSDAGVVVTENSPAGFDTITLTMPKGTDPSKFARLSATVTP